MKIKKLHLQNFRGAVKVRLGEGTLCFDDHINVFCGINGSGKTTILDAIYLMLSWLIAKRRSPSSSGAFTKDTDITNGMNQSAIEIYVDHNGKEYSWSVTKKRSGRVRNIKNNIKSSYTGANELAGYLEQNQSNDSQSKDKPVMPVLLYYPVTRAILDIPLQIRKRHKFNPLNCNDKDSKNADFRIFFEWFQDQEHFELREKEKGTLKDSDKCIDFIHQAIKNVMPGFERITIEHRPRPKHMEVIKNGQVLWIDQLSDGEKTLLALVADITRRLVIANQYNNINPNPLEGEGIILIDEVDLHLHPEWQKDVVSQLSKTFPNCQFFFTTHSPLVLNHIRPENIFLLKDKGEIFPLNSSEQGIGVTHPGSSYGKNCTRVLEDIMGVDNSIPVSIENKLNQIYDFISERKFKEAHNTINDLKNDFDYNEPELDKARTALFIEESIS